MPHQTYELEREHHPRHGGRDLEAGAVSVRLHHGGPQRAKPKGEVVAEMLLDIRDRMA